MKQFIRENIACKSIKLKAGYSQFFQALLALPEDRALLFHCSQGKDRTGCGAMLILFALGVDEETV
ncbi:MAG: tyrosine-protein phosphatase, partial [Clostridia bacterium]|nr:tyrosine-protein phosphatase [Clostridia bacterium]